MFSNILTVLGGRGVVRIAQFATFVILARVLSPTDFGWFGLITTAIALSTVLGSLGLRQSTAYWIGQKRMTAGQGVGTALVTSGPLAALAASAIAIWYLREDTGLAATGLVLVIAAATAGSMLVTLIQGVHLGRGDIRSFAVTDAIPKAVMLGVVVIVAFLPDGGLDEALWAYAVGFLIAAPVAVLLASRGVGRVSPTFRPLPQMLGYGIFFAFNLFLVTLCSRASMFVVEFFSGAHAAGEFYAAVRVNEIFLEVATAMGMVVFSHAARQTNDDSMLRNARLACWSFWAFAGLGVVVALLAPLLLGLVLGPGYERAAPALQVLAIGLGPTAAAKIIYPALAGRGRSMFGTPIIAVSLALNVGIALALVPSVGVTGGAIAYTVGQFVLFIGYVMTFAATQHIPVRRFFLPTTHDLRLIGRSISSLLRRRPFQ